MLIIMSLALLPLGFLALLGVLDKFGEIGLHDYSLSIEQAVGCAVRTVQYEWGTPRMMGPRAHSAPYELQAVIHPS